MIARKNPQIYCYKQSSTVHRCSDRSNYSHSPRLTHIISATIYTSYNFEVATIKPKINLVSNKIIYITKKITIYQLTLPNVH